MSETRDGQRYYDTSLPPENGIENKYLGRGGGRGSTEAPAEKMPMDKESEVMDADFGKVVKLVKEPETAELRYTDTVPLEEFRKQTIGIAGLGATGKAVATTLSVMGHKGLWGSDPDEVEMKNVGTQGWHERDIGQPKAEVLQDTLSNRRSTFIGNVYKFEDCFGGTGSVIPRRTTVFFCCVDTMRARIAIWNTLKAKHLLQGQKIWIESRIASRILRIMTIDLSDKESRKYYESTLYSDSSAFQGACTDRMTYYGAGIAAGLMVSQLVNWLNYGKVNMVDFMLETIGVGVTRIK